MRSTDQPKTGKKVPNSRGCEKEKTKKKKETSQNENSEKN
jgi:hypothetical protein